MRTRRRILFHDDGLKWLPMAAKQKANLLSDGWGSRCWCVPACVLRLASSGAQELEKPISTRSTRTLQRLRLRPDGRIVYAVNRPFKTKQYDLEHDDVWIQDAGGKKRRIFVGEKFQRGAAPFTYSVNSFRWSPNGHLILAELVYRDSR